MDLRPILFVIGVLLSIMSASMVFPMLADFYFGYDDWKSFFVCMVITSFFGGSLILSNRSDNFTLNARQTFVLTTFSWLALATFAALPFYLSKLNMSATDSFFEAMSGITTTGSTVMTNLNEAPAGILLWRAILQWLGGIGIIVMALSVLPFLKVGGMQLFRTESSENEKAMPRATQLASSIGTIYVAFTIMCTGAYMMMGMENFDALAHAMTTIATGGFSTFDESFSHYTDSAGKEIVAIIFMLLGSLPFILYLKALRGNVEPLLKDSQVRWFLSVVGMAVLSLTLYLTFVQDFHYAEAIRRSAFNVVSIITGTGYASADYGSWGNYSIVLFFFLMAVGGCAGSTTCGIKIFRFQILFNIAMVQLKKLLHPHGVFIAHYNGRALPDDVPPSIMSFFFIYILCFFFLAAALSFTGMNFMEALSGAMTSISNVGPALGEIGPAGDFAHLKDASKWILSFGMMLGRLELFTVLVLFTPYFWRT